VLTNAAITKVVNIDDGYPLPQDGGIWQWVGGWRVDKHVVVVNGDPAAVVSPKHRVDSDDEGWSYAEEYTHFATNPTELCWDHPNVKGTSVLRPYRRRKWTRKRALLSYPYASEPSKHFLRLMAENERNAIIASKLGDQLVDTKTKLTQAEENYITTKETLSSERDSLKQELTAREDEIHRMLQAGFAPDSGAGSAQPTQMNRLDQISKEGMTKVKGLVTTVVSTGSTAISSAAQSLRKPPDDRTVTTEEDSSSDNSEGQQRFDWRKLGRGAFLDHIKKTQQTASLVRQGISRRTNRESPRASEEEVALSSSSTEEQASVKSPNSL